MLLGLQGGDADDDSGLGLSAVGVDDAAAALTGANVAMKVRKRFERWVKIFAAEGEEAVSAAIDEVQAEILDAQKTGYGSGSMEMVAAIEALLVALLGNHFDFVRENAVVLLNVLYDGHDLQLFDPLPVSVACVGEAPVIRVPLSIKGVDPNEVSALKVRMFGPPSEGGGPPRWTDLPITVEAGKEIICKLRPFQRTGFYDWTISETTVLGPDARKVRGRFLVHPQGTRQAKLLEVPVDAVGAAWDEKTGDLLHRGSFDSVLAQLPDYKVQGYTGIYLYGALERPPSDDTSASNIADREAPASVLGGAAPFKNLTTEIARLGMVPIIDTYERVSRTAHRKYRSFVVHSLNDRGVTAPHPGTDCRENQWNESVLLNYRRVEIWDLMINEVKTLAREYGVRGIRLSNAQSYPLIMEADMKELRRLDTDGVAHYSLNEIFYGQIVKENEELGYWSTGAALDLFFPNPFLIKVVRELWNEFPTFMVMAEANFHREPQLLVSGVITHSLRIPQILASISGKSLRLDGSVSKLPPNKRSSAKTLSRVLKSDFDLLPSNSIVLQCTCTHNSPFPPALYGRRAWMVVDLINFLPGIPMSFLGEDTGVSYRMNMAAVSHHEEESMYHVNYDKLIPKSPTKRASPMTSPVDGVSALSLGEKLPTTMSTVSSTLRRPASLLDVRSMKRTGSASNLHRVDSASQMVQIRSPEHQKSLGIRSESIQDLNKIRRMNDEVRQELGPSAGFDISQIKGHYNHRALVREELPVFSNGRLWVLSVEPHFKDRIFCFARFTEEEVAVVAMNMKDGNDGDAYRSACDVEVKIQSLSEVLPETLVNRFQEVHRIVDGFTGDQHGKDLFTLEEFVFRKFTIHIEPLTTLVLMPKRVPQTPELLAEHAKQALSRLEVEATELKDPRENSITSRIARGAASSLSDFAQALSEARAGFCRMGLDDGAVQYQLQLCLQRASALFYNVLYEGFVSPRGYDPPRGERIISYLAHLTTAAADPDLLHICRKLILRSQKIGPLVFLASELGRFSTAGGLGVMVDELTKDLAALGLEVYVISPYYTVNRKGETKYIEKDGRKSQ